LELSISPERLTGRKELSTSLVPNDNNIIKILEKVIPQHYENAEEINYLYNYYKGNQNIYNRVKKVRPEINNKIVENHAYEIVEFKTGFTFGEPVQYVQRTRDKKDGSGEVIETTMVSDLNELMFVNDKASKDRELGEWMFIAGTAYRMALPNTSEEDDSPFIIDTLDPRSTFVVYSTGFNKQPVLGGIIYEVDSEDTIEQITRISLYSKNKYWEIDWGNLSGEKKIIKSESHVLGHVPIIEYPANPSRLGVFEPVMGLLDALNKVASNRLDGIEQFIQSVMKFVNCDIDEEEFKALSELGAIKISSTEGRQADVDILTSELDQQQTQTYVDYIYQTILTITGVPDRRASAGGNTGQALIVGQGWANAESRAIATELMFKRSETLFLKLILRILEDHDEYDVGDIRLSDIDVKFTRNKTDNLLVKTQGLQNMLEAGIHPRTAIEVSGLFSDPEQVFIDSLEYLERWKDVTREEVETHPNNKENPDIF
jgi:SPP1 family phage portal protein